MDAGLLLGVFEVAEKEAVEERSAHLGLIEVDTVAGVANSNQVARLRMREGLAVEADVVLQGVLEAVFTVYEQGGTVVASVVREAKQRFFVVIQSVDVD